MKPFYKSSKSDYSSLLSSYFISFTDILLHRSNLRTALQLSTAAQDNHLRALILSLIASQYVHTSPEHASTMLATAEQLGAGLGASGVKGGEKLRLGSKEDGVGNAHLRLWIGEKSLGDYRLVALSIFGIMT